MGIICQSIHSEKTVLEVSIRIGGRKSSDEIQDLEGVRLGHSLHNIVKLGLAAGNAFKPELRFGLNQPGFDLIRPEGRKLDSVGGKQVSGGESGGNTSDFLKDSMISWHSVS